VTDQDLKYEAPAPFAKGESLGRALLAPTRIYVKSVLAAIRGSDVKGLAHITGGGLTENVPRVVPDDLDIEIDLTSWTPLPIFQWLARTGGIEEREMLRTFNCGIGMIVVVSPERAEEAAHLLTAAGEKVFRLGSLIKGKGEPMVRYKGRLAL
jgi:phosphoribosylformylglycinamidine cyclo-ligase